MSDLSAIENAVDVLRCPVCHEPYATQKLEAETHDGTKRLVDCGPLEVEAHVCRIPVGEIDTIVESAVHLEAAGEIQTGIGPETIPLGVSQGELDELLKDNEELPRQVVVKVQTGKSKRGWNYTKKVLERIHGEVMKGGLPGYKGHLKPEDVSTSFPDPVTHWVGAKLEANGETLLLRGVVDRSETKLKGLMRARRITQTSIFGVPHLQRNPSTGEFDVVDYEPISNDWTPLKRAGMPTEVVYTGEMDRILQEGETPQSGEAKGETMNLGETLKNLRDLGAGPKAVIEAMGWTPQQIAGEIGEVKLDVIGPLVDRESYEAGTSAITIVGELQKTLGVDAPDKLVDAVGELKKSVDTQSESSFDDRVKSVIEGEIANEKARPFMTRMLVGKVTDKSTDADGLKKAVGELMESDDVVKETLKALGGVDKGVTSGRQTQTTSTTSSGTAGGEQSGASGAQGEQSVPKGLRMGKARIG